VVGYLNPAAEGIRNHICVLPCGGVFDKPVYEWSKEELAYYVRYHAFGKPVDRLFNGFVFRGYSASPGRYMHPVHCAFGSNATREDWLKWLDSLFASGKNFKALYALAGRSRLDVWVSLPYPPIGQEDFGSIWGTPVKFDTTNSRYAAVIWWIEKFLVKWRSAPYLSRKLAFRGFLWQRESINDYDEDLVKLTNQYIRLRGLRSMWLPFMGSYGTIKLGELGFDVVALHSNYYGNTMYDQQWIASTAGAARNSNAGMQVIYGKGPIYNRNGHLLDHLNYGLPELQDYMRKSLIVYQFPNRTMKGISRRHPFKSMWIYLFTKGLYTKVGYPGIPY